MIDFSDFYMWLVRCPPLHSWLECLPSFLGHLNTDCKKQMKRGSEILAELPELRSAAVQGKDSITIGDAQIHDWQSERINAVMRALRPWRKGPFTAYDLHIDSEWRSDLKWARLRDAISPLKHRNVLDVGCGNGYYLWRMLEAGASSAIGLDQEILCYLQFQAIYRLIDPNDLRSIFVIPLPLKAFPTQSYFDTVFCMGVLYHQRSPIDTLTTLKNHLREDGELVLETLVIDSNDPNQILTPRDRYANMRNVWFIPSLSVLKTWLQRCGFSSIEIIDVSVTTPQEQRATAWSNPVSLIDALSPNDPTCTIEGHPAPTRAIAIAKR